MKVVNMMKEKVERARQIVLGRIRDARPLHQKWADFEEETLANMEAMLYLRGDGVSGEDIDRALKTYMKEKGLTELGVSGRIRGWKFKVFFKPAPTVFEFDAHGKIWKKSGKEIEIRMNVKERKIEPLPRRSFAGKFTHIIGGILDAYLKVWIYKGKELAMREVYADGSHNNG